MHFDDHQSVAIAWVISNIVGLLMLLAAKKATKLARLLFVLLFGWASWTNYTVAHHQPELYLQYASMSISIYRMFINGWFSQHITVVVSVIAVCQAAIAIGMILGGVWVKMACIGSIVFLLAIAPLGVGAAFPFSLWVAAAAYFIMRRDDKRFLWQYRDY